MDRTNKKMIRVLLVIMLAAWLSACADVTPLTRNVNCDDFTSKDNIGTKRSIEMLTTDGDTIHVLGVGPKYMELPFSIHHGKNCDIDVFRDVVRIEKYYDSQYVRLRNGKVIVIEPFKVKDEWANPYVKEKYREITPYFQQSYAFLVKKENGQVGYYRKALNPFKDVVRMTVSDKPVEQIYLDAFAAFPVREERLDAERRETTKAKEEDRRIIEQARIEMAPVKAIAEVQKGGPTYIFAEKNKQAGNSKNKSESVNRAIDIHQLLGNFLRVNDTLLNCIDHATSGVVESIATLVFEENPEVLGKYGLRLNGMVQKVVDKNETVEFDRNGRVKRRDNEYSTLNYEYNNNKIDIYIQRKGSSDVEPFGVTTIEKDRVRHIRPGPSGVPAYQIDWSINQEGNGDWVVQRIGRDQYTPGGVRRMVRYDGVTGRPKWRESDDPLIGRNAPTRWTKTTDILNYDKDNNVGINIVATTVPTEDDPGEHRSECVLNDGVIVKAKTVSKIKIRNEPLVFNYKYVYERDKHKNITKVTRVDLDGKRPPEIILNRSITYW